MALSATTSKLSSKESESEPIYFWKPEEELGWLGQWYESPFHHEGVVYRTAEMWMMVQKAKLFRDEVRSDSGRYKGKM